MLAISTDSIYAHKMEGLHSPNAHYVQYPVLSDRNHEISRAYGVYNPEEGRAYRGLFIIDPQGILRGYMVYNDTVGRSADEILRALQAYQYVAKTGRRAQANWQPGWQGLLPQWEDIGKF